MSATTVDELQVLISANASQFQQEIKKVQAQMGEMNQSMKSSTSGMRGLSVAGVAMGTMIGAAMSKVAGILSSQLNPAISRLDTLNNFPRAMANLGVSSSLSEKSIAVLSEKLKGLPTTLDDAAMSVQRFTSANGSIGASTQMFLALNNAILAGGSSTNIQRTALEQLSQAYAKGKPDMMEWRSLMTAMPAQLKQIAQSMNYASSADLGEALREGKLSMNDFMAQIVKLNREGFSGFASFEEQARNSTGGVATSLANLRNAAVRAVTDIMNIVGQTNISGFFQGVANAINAVVPYVAAFVKVVMMAIGALRTLFGGGGKSSPQKATAEISNNLGSAGSNAGNLADSAGGAGKKLGGATKQAKKLAEQLAGFDEMNVLKTPEEPSGGGSESSGGGGGAGRGISGVLPDFGEINTSGLNSVAKKAEEIAQRIKKFFEGIFDFDPLMKSLKVFPDGGYNLIGGLVKIGEKFVSNFIIPVAKFQIEKTIPTTLTAIGEALKSINFKAVAESVGNLFTEIGNSVNLISSTFAGLIEIAAPFGAWVANFAVPPAFEFLATVIKVVTTALEGVGFAISGLWKMIEPAFKALGEALKPVLDWLGKTLKAIRENETFMNILKDAFTAATIVIIGPLVAAFGAIVVAITAVIEIINLVVRFFTEGWSSTVRVWNGAGAFFAGVSNNIRNAFSGIGQWFSNIFNNARNLIFNSFSSVGKWFSDRWNDIKNVFSNAWQIFSSIGRNIWEGLKAGIGNLAAKVGNIFKNAVDGVKNFLGIHSPSRLFRSYGGFVGEGFALGINGEQAAVSKALENLTSSFKPEIPPFEFAEMPKLSSNLPDISKIGGNFEQKIEASISDRIEKLNERSINLTVNVGNEKMLEQLIDGINSHSFMNNASVIDL